MVNFPKVLRAGSFFYKVFTDERNFKRICSGRNKDVGEDEYIKGLTDNLTCELTINPEIGSGNQVETSMHEALHCAWYAAQLSQTALICELEEEIVSRLSPMLLMIIRDNPGFVKIWQQDLVSKPRTRRSSAPTGKASSRRNVPRKRV